jgi:hypothetical protein
LRRYDEVVCYECHAAFLTRLNRLTGSLFVGAVRGSGRPCLSAVARRESVQMRSTIEANPFERCGVKRSANPRRGPDLFRERDHGRPDGFRYSLNRRPNALGWRIDYFLLDAFVRPESEQYCSHALVLLRTSALNQSKTC